MNADDVEVSVRNTKICELCTRNLAAGAAHLAAEIGRAVAHASVPTAHGCWSPILRNIAQRRRRRCYRQMLLQRATLNASVARTQKNEDEAEMQETENAMMQGQRELKTKAGRARFEPLWV